MKKLNLLIYIMLLSSITTFAQTFNQASVLTCFADVDNNGVADDLDVSFTSSSVPADSGTISIYFQGDFDTGVTEELEVLDENGILIANAGNTVLQCGASLDTFVFRVSQTQILGWMLDGVVDFTLSPGTGVNMFCANPCGGAAMRLEYPISISTEDAAVTSADSTFPYCAGTHDIIARIANFGTNQLDSVDIEWELNGVAQPTFLFRSTLDTVNGSNPFDTLLTIGTASLKAGSDTIKIWTSNPNGLTDSVNFNDTIYFTVSSSPEPTNYLLSNITPTTVEVYADFVGDLEIEWGLQGFTIGTGTRDTTSSSPYTVTGLTSGTEYDIYIRTNCGGGDFSAWRRRTITTSFTTPYFQDFEAFAVPTIGDPWDDGYRSTSNTLPRWESEDASGFNENSTFTGPLFDHTNFGFTGGNYIYFESWFPFGIDSADFWSPPIYVPPTQNVVELSFWYFMYGSEMQQLQILVDTNGVENLVGVIVGQQQTAQTDEWRKHSVYLNGYAGKSISVRFRGFLDVFQLQTDLSDYAIDDIAVDSVPALNASVDEIVNPAGALCPGTIDPAVVVTNRGVNTITTLDIESNINGVLDTTTASVNIITGDTAQVYLNSVTFNSGTLYDLQFRLITANGATDDVAADDTVSLNGITTGLTGNVTIDPSLATSATNFVSFDSLAFALNNVGLCGNVTVTVAAGNYTDNLVLGEIKGAGPNSRLTIDGIHRDSVKIIRGTINSNSPIVFNGTDYVTVKNMRVENLNTSPADQFGIWFSNNASYDSIVNVRVIMSPTATFNVTGIGASSVITNDFGEGNNANHITVMNSEVSGGAYSVHFEGQSGNWNVGNHFYNNRLVNFASNAYYMDDQDSIKIIGDSVINPRDILDDDGIYLFDVMNFDIEENYISVGDWAVYMTNANSGKTPDAMANFVNNMIYSNADYGVYMTNPLQVNFWHNTIYSGSSSSVSAAARFANFGFIDSMDIRNNIFFAEGTWAMDYEGDSSTTIKLDFNTYESNGTNLLNMDGVDYVDLAAYQVNQPLLNVFSLEGDPQFVSKVNGDLHINGTLVNDAGDNAVNILTDIDGDVRPMVGATFVDIGADEYDPPPCPAPLFLRASNLAGDSATIFWQSSVLGNDVQIEILRAGAIRDTAYGLSVSDSVNVDTLTANTDYEVYVREICGRGDTSGWAGPLPFSTPCDDFFPRYFDNWDDAAKHTPNTKMAPDCWYGYSTQINGDVEIQNFNSFSTPNVLVLESWTGTTDSAIAITPRFPNMVNGNTFIEFQFATQNVNQSLIIGTADRPSNGANFNNMDTISLTSTNAYEKVVFDISTANGYNGTDQYIVFSHDYGATFSDLRIDDFTWDTVPACRAPLGLTATQISDTSATLNWSVADTNGTSWIIQYDSTAGTSPTDTIVTAHPFTLNGLAANTDYEFRVMAICGADTALWSDYQFFKTLCAPFQARHFEDFDGMSTNVMAECWTSYYTSASGNIAEPQVEFLGAGAYSANNSLEFTSWNMVHPTDSTIMWTPLYTDLTDANKQIQFFTQAQDTTVYMIVGTADEASPAATFNILDTIMYDQANVWKQEIVTLDTANGYNGTDRFVYFRHSLTATFQDIRIDDYEYDVIPSCPSARDLRVDLLGSDTVIYTWNDPAGASQWEVRYGTDLTVDSLHIVKLTSNRPDTLMGLDPNTFYEVQVRPICTVGDTGKWSAVLSFRTACEPFTAPYFTNFDQEVDGTIPGCWGDYVTWAVAVQGGVFVENFNSRSIPNNLEINSWNGYTAGSDTLGAWTPEFKDLTDGDKQLRFWGRTNDIVNTQLIVMTADERSSSANFTVIDTHTYAANNIYEEVTIKLDSANGYNGTDKYILLAHSLTALGTFDELVIDDFNYEEIPTCQRVDQINVTNVPTGDSIFVDFRDPNLNTVSYIVEYDTVGFVQGTGDTVIITGNPDTITGLNHSTRYQMYITTICAGGDTSNLASNVYTFSTTCLNFPAPYFEDFDAVENDSIPNCWTEFYSYVINSPNGGVFVRDAGFPAPFAVKSLYMNSWFGFSAATDRMNIVSPPLDSITNGNMRLNLQWNTDNITSGIVVGTVPDLSTIAAITPLDTLVATTANNWTAATIDITTANGYNGTDEYLIFAHTLGGTIIDVVMDDFDYEEIPSCLAMENLRAFDIGSDSARITFRDPNVSATLEYIIEWDTAGFALGTGNILVVTNDTFDLTGLTFGTGYQYYITAVCTIGDTSNISLMGSFTTDCLPFVPVVLPWIEDWESIDGIVTEGGLVNCDTSHGWFFESNQPEGRVSYGSFAEDFSQGNGAVTLDVTTNGVLARNLLVLTIDLSNYKKANDLELSFDVRDHGDEVNAGDSVWIRHNPTAPWVGIFDVGNNVTGIWTRWSFDIDNLLGSDTVSSEFQIGFGQEDNFAAPTDGISYDSIRIEGTLPVCEPPTTLNSVPGTDWSDLSWSDIAGANNWEIRYSELDTNGVAIGYIDTIVGQDTARIDSLNPSTIVGSDTSRIYYAWNVRAICGPGDTSAWAVLADTFQTNFTVGLDNFDQAIGHFTVTPNPSTGLFNLSIGTLRTENITMKVRDVRGQIVHEEQVNVNGVYNDQFDFRSFAKGVYYLEVRTETTSRIEKLVIQ